MEVVSFNLWTPMFTSHDFCIVCHSAETDLCVVCHSAETNLHRFVYCLSQHWDWFMYICVLCVTVLRPCVHITRRLYCTASQSLYVDVVCHSTEADLCVVYHSSETDLCTFVCCVSQCWDRVFISLGGCIVRPVKACTLMLSVTALRLICVLSITALRLICVHLCVVCHSAETVCSYHSAAVLYGQSKLVRWCCLSQHWGWFVCCLSQRWDWFVYMCVLCVTVLRPCVHITRRLYCTASQSLHVAALIGSRRRFCHCSLQNCFGTSGPCCQISVRSTNRIRYNTIDDLHWKTDRQATSLI